ncbi:MAG: hypothetical protein BWX88_02201 [Planctomycetes bacterium ADurb.Bin126]|nr:MAG: hypothetical protein BWX88_02201 [Planctomycetes bacterium ADurb.Bin126]HOD79795.1 hypothetical protein [Phycisphaerae bacterium]HQL72803.1 hypothetical protein [Phycisphaerae bacterium]
MSTRGLTLGCVLLGLLQAVAPAADATALRCAGVLGNSGEQGKTLVRLGPEEASGIGVVVDKYGTLWDRGGAGTLNRYAPDGRLLGSYPIAGGRGNRGSDVIALLGDTIVLRLGDGLYALNVDDKPGTPARPLNVPADRLSLTARDGWLAASKGKDVFLVNAEGKTKPLATLPSEPHLGVSFDAEGNVCADLEWKLHRVVAGGSPVLLGPVPGERPLLVDGYWYGSAWHSTLRRFDASLQPAPGVVLGGNSGSFIGHVAEQAEIVNSRGLARVRGDLFAISGLTGVLHLAAWNGDDLRFEVVRRIGAAGACSALALDSEGRTWFRAGSWNWDDGPASPLRWGIPEPDSVFGLAVRDDDAVVGYGVKYGKCSIFCGKLDKEIRVWQIEGNSALPKSAVAVAAIQEKGRHTLLVLDNQGRLAGFRVGGDGRPEGDAAPTTVRTAKPVKEWTSLAALSDDKLVAAGDGQVIELARNGADWKETARWNSWGEGPGEKLGGSIRLASESGRLWVADATRHRVVCLSLDGRKLLGTFGQTDRAGDDLAHLSAPAALAARGGRAVVFDSGNQRLVRIQLSSGH